MRTKISGDQIPQFLNRYRDILSEETTKKKSPEKIKISSNENT